MGQLITLTTDFGQRDAYVAAMKGVISSIAQDATILDLSHEIAPQDIREAALFLREAIPWFPAGSIHVAVVDPGVGTVRAALALDLGGRFLLCPDNGLCRLLLQTVPLRESIILVPEKCTTHGVSNTFHGRDVFAPAAARIATGTPMRMLGKPAGTLAQLPWAVPEQGPAGTLLGEVIHIDRFGNCITNIPGEGVASGATAVVRVADAVELPLRRTYGDAGVGEFLALVGSSGFVEVAVNQGNAATAHHIAVGTPAALIPGAERGTDEQ